MSNKTSPLWINDNPEPLALIIEGKEFCDKESWKWLYDAVKEKLNREQLDENGLARCGCGGVAEELFDGFSFDGDGMECNDYVVKCNKCGMQTKVIQTRSEKTHDLWNTAMGYRGIRE